MSIDNTTNQGAAAAATVTLPNLKDMVKDGKKVTFVHYKVGELWYRTECGFEFPVPAADVGNATLLAQDKALLFMRYIRPHLKMLQEARTAADCG